MLASASSEASDGYERQAQLSELDLVVVRYDDQVSVLYGRCHHRGALLGDGHIDGQNLICGVHGWDYRYDTGISEYNNDEALHKFEAEVRGDWVWVDEDEVIKFLIEHPQPFNRDEYKGDYADTHPEPTEPSPRNQPEMLRADTGSIG